MDRIGGAAAEGAEYLDEQPGPAACYRRTRQAHAACMVCGEQDDGGSSFGLHFAVDPVGSVEASFRTTRKLQGYDGMLHGGVISTLLDAAMVHCLFAHGIVAVTVEMTVRFRRAVPVDRDVTISAKLTGERHGVLLVTASLTQADRPFAEATGKFWRASPDDMMPGGKPIST